MGEPDLVAGSGKRTKPNHRRILWPWLIAGALLAIAVVTGAYYLDVATESSYFCGRLCHPNNPEYATHQVSAHAQVECGTCHVGPGLVSKVKAKIYGVHELTSLITNTYGRPIEPPVESLRPARDICEQCHWPDKFYADRVAQISRFASDEANSETKTFLVLRTGGGNLHPSGEPGIHWHIDNPVSYVALDPSRQEIPWIGVTGPDGKLVEYVDATAPLSKEELEKLPRRVMDCLDCHNRATHDFRKPEDSVDEALAAGKLDPKLPYIKREAVRLLSVSYANQEAGVEAMKDLERFYSSEYPKVYAEKKQAVAQAVETLQGIYRLSFFPDMNLSWQTYPNNIGHTDTAGCFRCHDGKHVTASGEPIRLNCSICHSIPVVTKPGEKVDLSHVVNFIAQANRQPEGHKAPSFMREHRYLAGDSCTTCHGPLRYGSDNSSFCANSACHGRQWPEADLDAAAAHPIPLVGKHAQVACNACHKGVAKPSTTCGSCHQPKATPHYGAACESCHSPLGWAEPVGAIRTGWAASGHNDVKSEAFVHWDKENPPIVPKTCARCHSGTGFQDFLGADGSPANVADRDAKIGSTIGCTACHNAATDKLKSVTFPSGAKVEGLGREAICMQCHQGRASKQTVDAGIAKAGVKDVDTVSAGLGFTNIHYFAAAATQYGSVATGGYQYDGKTYDSKFAHVDKYDTCTGCHDPHSLRVKVADCASCHMGVKSEDDLKKIRMQGSLKDYDGDGDVSEGIFFEIEGLRTQLYAAMRAYAAGRAGSKLAYSPDSYPYFFIDKNDNGQVDADEARPENGFAVWTARLTKAAYNYHTSLKDPGGYAHNGKYMIELLYDSIEDLNAALSQPIDLSKAHRIDAGHFAGSAEAFRHWDKEGQVPDTCSRCHSADGLPQLVRDGKVTAQPPSNGLRCTTCHDPQAKNALCEVKKVTFPSGAAVDSADKTTNLCMSCHQGRESMASVNKLVEGIGVDERSPKLRFLNVHYLAAGATLYGGEAQGAYQYAGKTYVGRSDHARNAQGLNNCGGCHSVHELGVQVDKCGTCHKGVKSKADLRSIRMSTTDYDGDGDRSEGTAQEIEHLRLRAYQAMQTYARQETKTSLLYDDQSYPYFFVDGNNNGKLDPEEARADNAFGAWTPRLVEAAYNLHYVTKDPGAFAHNPRYILQILYDTLQNLGEKTSVDMSRLVRP